MSAAPDVVSEAAATVACVVTVVAVERLTGRGELRGLIDADLEIGGLVLAVSGIQLRQCRGQFSIHPPQYRTGTGKWKPAIELPDVIMRAIVRQPVEQCHALRDVPATETGDPSVQAKAPRPTSQARAFAANIARLPDERAGVFAVARRLAGAGWDI